MWVGIVTLLPEMFERFSDTGVARRAFAGESASEHGPSSAADAADGGPASGITCEFFNPRDFTQRKHGQVDDKPYGGGPGMVLQAQPLESALSKALERAPTTRPTLIVPAPQGQALTHELVQTLAAEPALVFLCGRYEGIDQRVLDHASEVMDVREVSLGDFVLTGGELPVQVLLDAISRWLPGTLGNADSAAGDSFADGLLEGGQYTRPERLEDGREVPAVLMSGDHERIARYRRKAALARTLARRPELLLRTPLNALDRELLQELWSNRSAKR